MSKKVLFCIECIWLLILLILVSLYYLSQANVSAIFNSDIIILPSLFKDLLVNNNHYRDWFLSPAPHFFPDAFLYYFTGLLTKNIYFQVLIFKWVRVIIIYFIVKYLYCQFFTRKMSILFSLMVTSLLIMLSLREFLAYNTLLMPSVHESELIIGLFLTTLIIKLIDDKKQRNNLKIFSLFSVLIFLCSASDMLFFVQFPFPFVFSLITLYIKKWINLNKLLTLSSLSIFPAIAGNFLSKYMVPHQVLFAYLNNPSLKKISFTTLAFQVSELIKLFKSTYIYLPWYIFILFYFSIISIFIFRIIINKNKKNFINQKIFFLSAFVCFCIITNIAILLILIHVMADRYFLPFYYFAILLFFIPLYIFEKKLILKKIFACIFIMAVIYCLIKISPAFFKQNLKPKFSYYPTEISCIDRSLPPNTHGIAEYWDANILSLLSKKNISIAPVSVFLEPVYWSINSTVFAKPSNFVILSKINPLFDLIPNVVLATYGLPEKIIQCGTKKLLIYPKDSLRPMKLPLFSHSGDSFNWPASLLPSLIPNSIEENKRIAQPNDLITFISYGPYISLPSGKYHFYIYYKSNESSKSKVAFYDVYSGTIGEISKKFIYGSKGNIKEISGKFKVKKMQNNKHKYEIRVFFLGKSKFELESITLVRD